MLEVIVIRASKRYAYLRSSYMDTQRKCYSITSIKYAQRMCELFAVGGTSHASCIKAPLNYKSKICT